MSLEILTKNDLKLFKEELIKELKSIIANGSAESKQWLKSSEVRKLLKISAGTLQNFRVNGTLPYTKIGGVIFYAYEDILQMLEENKFNQQ
ncbi:helix-turn-helix domain-containing protein [Reichenbachiella sp. MALMAid0571]|uniref:helix-turn-helix domain-containing protein n=1 Tax=Reichenbachiella sp. MALMAid0571 TaxID=3143939 RepID=UPI0032DE8105